MSDETLGRFKRWFWRPPRPHGETIADRTVSFLELFYDLVYVAVIAQAAHHLAEHVSVRGFAEFAVVFALIWTAWVNGSLYLELHGREDGRTRNIVFVQMGVLVLLAVFTADAADDSGRGFALVYATFLAISTWLWNTVRRQDRRDHPEFLAVTGRYVIGMGVAVVVIFASAFLPAEPRLLVWAGVVIAWIVGMVLVGRSRVGLNRGVPPTDSLVERFGLFTIIVLGEFVFGVVDGLSSPERDVLTITTGMIALVIGFGFWWIYFDLVGRRLPRDDGRGPGELAAEPPAHHAVHRRGRCRDGQPDRPCPRCEHAREHGVVALRCRGARPARPDRHRTSARRCRASGRRLPTAQRGDWPGERPPPSSSAGHDRRRGSLRCCSWRSSRCSGSSPSAASCAPTPGAMKARPRRLTPPEAIRPNGVVAGRCCRTGSAGLLKWVNGRW